MRISDLEEEVENLMQERERLQAVLETSQKVSSD
jgi:hypothetical protein